MIEKGKSADQLEKGKVNKRLAEAIAQDKGNSHGQGYYIDRGQGNSRGQREQLRAKALARKGINDA